MVKKFLVEQYSYGVDLNSKYVYSTTFLSTMKQVRKMLKNTSILDYQSVREKEKQKEYFKAVKLFFLKVAVVELRLCNYLLLICCFDYLMRV